MASINFDTTRTYLQEFNFARLFIEILGWSNVKGVRPIELEVEDIRFTATPISQLAGVVVFEVTAENGMLPNKKHWAVIHKEIAKSHHENLIIFLDKEHTQSLWYWVKREDKRKIPRDHLYVKGQPGDLFLGKLSSMFVDISELDESGNINVLEVAKRLQKALDVQPVTKKFYTDFAAQRLEFIKLLQGIDNDHDRRWYASVLLNRMMFIYFLQRKGFVNNSDLEYLQKKLDESKKRGANGYFSEFLNALFFEGFAKPEEKRSEQAKKMLGKIRYLNGGLFLPHPVELNPNYKIAIPDKAFENLLKLFGSYSWNLDDTPGGDDNEINPDVLGYIFEKYINQKAFGAYYTRPEITEYLCEQTIYRVILQKINMPGLKGVLVERNFEKIEDLLTNLDAALCKQLLFDVLPKLSILDPACGSGAFLVAAMRTLINVYSAITGRIDYLNDKALRDWLDKTRREHPNLSYFIKRSIITDNLFGVDIMEEASEIARLRLFLALVASVQRVEHLEPLPNIDFNVLPGNSLIGMLRVNEEDFNSRLGSQSSYEQGSLIPNYKQGGLFQQKTYRQIVNEKKVSLDSYRNASSFTEDLQALRDAIQTRRAEDYANLNDMLVDEFKALEIKYEQAIWDEKKKEIGKAKRRAVQIQDIQALQPFHWGYEFDEVMNERGGFDVIITNPPWDIFKPNAKEFFAEHSDLITKKKMTIEEFEKEQDKLLQQKDIREAWFEYLNSFPHISAYYRSASQFANQISIVNGKRVGSDINLYKLFVEQCFNLLKPKGSCGMVIPSGIYTDLGAKQLRQTLFERATILGLFCFENRREIFEGVHRSFKIVVLSFEKGAHTTRFPAEFMRLDVKELSNFPNENSLLLSPDLIYQLSPDAFSITEFRNVVDLEITKKLMIYPNIGKWINENPIPFSREFMSSEDHHFFNYIADGLTVFEGKMFDQFDHQFEQPKWWISEKELKRTRFYERGDWKKYRFAIRRIARNTDSRTLIATMLPKDSVVVHSVFVNVENILPYTYGLYFISMLNSFVADFYIRTLVSSNVSQFALHQVPIPQLNHEAAIFTIIVEHATKLICTAPEFDELAKQVGLGSYKNGVTDPKVRARLRAELDGMIAHLYSLTESEFAHILSTFPLVAEEVKSAAMDEFRKLAPNPELMMLIQAGETDKAEFKVGAFRKPGTDFKDPTMVENVLKSIAAFMNTKGGTLLIGVDDHGNIAGIDSEYAVANPAKKNWDGYVLKLADAIMRPSIPNSSQYCKFERVILHGKDICRATVEPAPEPVYFMNEFFIREGNRRRVLSVKEGHDYILRHWKR